MDILNCMMKYGMYDLSRTDCLFAWNNKQQEESSVFSKLDRVMVNDACSEMFLVLMFTLC